MHGYFYNEAIFDLAIRPETPLLIKSGSTGDDALDPTLAHMSFVRTQRPGHVEEEVYIPGSSIRGVLRSHAEKLLRSQGEQNACNPTHTKKIEENPVCFANVSNTAEITGPHAYNGSCYACQLFGNMMIASRLRITDLYIKAESPALLSRRYGVAIDRITGAVANGPFEMEILTDALFGGQLTVRNFTIGQLGLIAGTLLDLGDGLVPLGYGKSRGLGRVKVTFAKVTIRTLKKSENRILGVGALARAKESSEYELPSADDDQFPIANATGGRQRGFYTLQSGGSDAVEWLEAITGQWLTEVGDG